MKTNQELTNEDLTDEELDHERECCGRFVEAQSNYIRIVEKEPDSWLKANAALEELWAAYQASPCACAEKPTKAESEPTDETCERFNDAMCALVKAEKACHRHYDPADYAVRNRALETAWAAYQATDCPLCRAKS